MKKPVIFPIMLAAGRVVSGGSQSAGPPGPHRSQGYRGEADRQGDDHRPTTRSGAEF